MREKEGALISTAFPTAPARNLTLLTQFLQLLTPTTQRLSLQLPAGDSGVYY